MTSQKQNVTMKFSDVDVKQISVESVKMGKDQVPLLRYGSDKRTLFIQGPWIKMRQYGLPPGKTLANGIKNEYYVDEESRKSLRIPVDKSCAVLSNPKDPSTTNEDDIDAFIQKLKEIDAHIKNSSQFMKSANVDPDDKEKYTNIYRKPSKPKKPTADPKEKYYSMKLKFDVDNKSGQIRTEFTSINGDTNEKSVSNDESGNVSLETLEKLLTYNVEICPLFQLVKIWTQTTGAWGVTLKLKKCRVKKYAHTKESNAEFLDSDDESTPKKVASSASASAEHVTKKVHDSDGSDNESDGEQLKKQESDSSDSEEVKPVTKGKAVKKEDTPESSDSEEVKPVTKGKGKATTVSKKK